MPICSEAYRIHKDLLQIFLPLATTLDKNVQRLESEDVLPNNLSTSARQL